MIDVQQLERLLFNNNFINSELRSVPPLSSIFKIESNLHWNLFSLHSMSDRTQKDWVGPKLLSQ